MTTAEKKELFYLRLLPADEIAEQICSYPYALVETIIETSLRNEDFLFDLLTEIVSILKNNMHLLNAKKALRKLLRVCQVLGCIGYFDFGDWEAFRNSESQSERETQRTEKKPSLQCNDKIQKLKQKLNVDDASLLDDLITVPSSASLEKIIAMYWNNFENVIPEMFTDFICQKTNRPYSEKTIKELIKRTKPIKKYKGKPKK